MIKKPLKKSAVKKAAGKIPGVQKEDGSDCCGGGCCFEEEKKQTCGVWNKKQYLDLINQVLDPETGVGITDMGLIYDTEEEADGLVKVTMTLTSMGCPAGGQITTEIDAMLRLQPHVKDVKIEVVWEPAWNPAMMNPDVKAMLFGN
jgi:metal-sulfur cluster biosynthetic enzyme